MIRAQLTVSGLTLGAWTSVRLDFFQECKIFMNSIAQCSSNNRVYLQN